ncbi:helix-turn-helix domain-containing protein [Streptomyces yaizuensis]|uniref:helix-turn-helix domain-containing protein n=1 Tax=Streptomyces yaizuensis TaxID=2989713 RepID=UPI002B2003E2|nr:helix-turn-helix transcriptional regulator [Streptomyces sp. YSPA8]
MLASQAGVGQPTVSKVENGRMVPSPDVLDRLSRTLELDAPTRTEVDELLAVVEAAPPSGEHRPADPFVPVRGSPRDAPDRRQAPVRE